MLGKQQFDNLLKYFNNFTDLNQDIAEFHFMIIAFF